MKNLEFKVEGSEIDNFPYKDFPIRNMTLSKIIIRSRRHFKIDDVKTLKLHVLLKFLENYASIIETLNLDEVYLSTQQFYDMLKTLVNLRSFKSSFVRFELSNTKKVQNSSIGSNLRYISHGDNNFQAFETFKNLEVVKCINYTRDKYMLYSRQPTLNVLLEKVPSIQHLILEGIGTSFFFDWPPFNFKLRKLEAHSTNLEYHEETSISSFFQSQKGYLKDLKLKRLPLDFDGGEILKFIFEEMNLEKFVYFKTTLIENGRKVKIDEIFFMEIQIKAGMELMRQYPGNILGKSHFKDLIKFILGTKKLHFLIKFDGIDPDKIFPMLNAQTDLFLSIQELKVTGDFPWFPYTIELSKLCCNVRKLTIHNEHEIVEVVWTEFLPFMTQLKEIQLNFELTEEIIQIIKENCPSIEKIETSFCKNVEE